MFGQPRVDVKEQSSGLSVLSGGSRRFLFPLDFLVSVSEVTESDPGEFSPELFNNNKLCPMFSLQRGAAIHFFIFTSIS